MVKIKNIGIIGGGNMGEAILASCRKHLHVCVSEKSVERQRYLIKKYRIKSDRIEGLAQRCSVIILAVKPQDFDETLASLKPFVTKRHLIISVAAGITTNYIEKKLGGRVRVIRTMPNLPAVVQRAVTALARGRFAQAGDLKIAGEIFDRLGKTLIVKEELIDMVTATSGSGPGYVFFLMEQMIEAAKKVGLSEQVAAHLVIETFAGSVHLLKSVYESPATLRAKVTSKGGTTHAAVEVFKKHKVGKIFVKALQAAVRRAKQLSRR
ncbi:MAG TPA: pyrroline-5-carboxylate reductase [Candidatus Omnitrophota bacterium]|nr:pyrroline-5-carboxylate reductase [Candidatus Omnitrophota bacterium]